MNSSYDSELEDGLKSALPEGHAAVPKAAGVGVLLDDPMNRRLVESASVHLELEPELLERGSLNAAELTRFELIVAEQDSARAIQAMLSFEDPGDGIKPGVIAVRAPDFDSAGQGEAERIADEAFEGILTLPMQPGPVAAQLSLILYAHRAFARRYHSALEELHLNRRIFRSVTSGISVADAQQPDLPLSYVNPAFEVMTGYTLGRGAGQELPVSAGG